MARGTRQSAEEITFVLLGVLGSGKSSTGNSILGYKHFKVGAGTLPITTTCQSISLERFDKKIIIIDTPGLKRAASLSEIKEELKQLSARSQPDKVVYALTIRIGRYTNEERSILEELFKKNKSILKNCIIIFTNRNELLEEDNPADQIVDAWIKKNPSLQKLIKDNQLKFLAFENKRLMEEENNNQVRDLMSVVSGTGRGEEPVSGKLNTKKKIYVERESLVKMFGDYGGEFYDKHEASQNP